MWLLAEQLENANKTKMATACDALRKLLTNQPDKKSRALAVGASAVLHQMLAMHQGQPKQPAYSVAVSAWLALTLTPDQGTLKLADADNNPP